MRRPDLVLTILALTACSDAATTTDVRDATAPDTADTTDTTTSEPDDGAGDADAKPPTPAEAFAALEEEWCQGYASRWCGRAEACGCEAAPGFPSDGCEASFVAQCRHDLAQYEGAVLGGEAIVQLAAIESCLTTLGALFADCARLPNDLFFVSCGILTPPGGFGALPGAGSPCAEGGLCALGLRCGSEGACRTPGAASASCQGPTDCAPTLVCRDGSCAAPDVADAGKACAGPDGCSGDTTCEASAVKRCVVKNIDDPCRWDDDCVAGQYCAGDTCADLPGDGALCANGASCAAGLGCSLESGTCGALPGSGEACALGTFGPVLCAAGTTCIDGVCGAIPGEGDPCAMGVPACADGLGCAFEREGSFCRAPADVGAECQNDPTCKDGLFCDFGVGACQPHRARGAECSAGNECGDGACLPDATFTFRCADRPGADDACFIDECAPGLACRTPYTEGACVGVFCGALDF